MPLTKIPFIPYNDQLRSKFETLKHKELHVLDSKIFPKGFRIPKFYLGKPMKGLLWLFTVGIFGFGTLIDLFTIGSVAEAHNTKLELNVIRKKSLNDGNNN